MTLPTLDDRPTGEVDLGPYVSELARVWHRDRPAELARELQGTLVFADISGFTRLTERLARRGRSGAEEMSDHLDLVLSELLNAAYDHGGWLVKWGGDALLLGFNAPDHAALACAASAAMRSRMRRVGVLDTSVGRVRLRMSVGVHTGRFGFHFLGHRHRELLITGAAATVTARLEATAEAGEILLSPQTAALLAPECRGERKGDGILLVQAPQVALPSQQAPPPSGEVTGLIPELVAAHLTSGGGSGEHRQVAVAFLEFSGMQELESAHGAEVVDQALKHLVEVAQEACHRNGVSFHETDISPDGGKFMLVAGAPRGLEDPDEAMLCTLRQVLDDPGPLSLRAGVTAGRVFSGAVGPPRRRSYSVKGDVVNLAARIMGKTPPGEIWALPTVVEGSRTQFELGEIPPFMVKGKTAPVVVRSVGQPLAHREAGRDLPLAGRTDELDLLDAAIERALTGHGTHIDLVGPVGIGKTRLLTELISRATGMAVLQTTAELYRASSPYALFRPVLRAALDLDDTDAVSVEAGLTAWCHRLAPDLLDWVPLLAPIFGATIEDTALTGDIAPEFRADRTQQLVLDVLRNAHGQPTVIAVDDMQFADEASAALLRYLAHNVAGLPWIVVLADRTAWTEPQPPTSRQIDVGPLGPDAALVLVHSDTDDHPLSPHLAEAVVARSGGNPLFLRQLAATAHGVADSADLPDSIETVVAARIDSLTPRARDVLRAASVAGLGIERPLLRRLLDNPDADVDPVIDGLAEFLAVDGIELKFRQAVIRDTAYEGLPFRRRAALHARMAELLTERYPAEDHERATVLSLHYSRAGDYARALPLATAAANRARDAFANAEAILLYDRALAAAARLPNVDPNKRADLLTGLGDAQMRLGEYLDSDKSYVAACRLLPDKPLLVARIGLKRARTATQRAAYALALRRLRRVTSVLTGVPGEEAASLRLEVGLGVAITQFRQGRLAASRTTYATVADGGDERRDGRAIADALVYLDVIDTDLGVEVDGSRSKRALRLQQIAGDLAGQARVLTQIGYRDYRAGAWDDAVDSYVKARELVARLGDLPNVALTNANIAEIRLDQGRVAEAESALEQAIRVWRASGSDNDVAFGRALLGRALAKQGRFEEADTQLDLARASFVAHGAKGEVIDADAYRAESLLLRGRPAAAAELARETLTAARRLSDQPVQTPLLLRVIGGSEDALGHHDEADLAFDEALAVARHLHAGHELAFTVAAMAARTHPQRRPIDLALIEEIMPLQRRLGIVIDLTAPADHVPSPRTARGAVHVSA